MLTLNTIHQGDALDLARRLPSESVHLIVTSPPYWGLRDYGTGTWEGGSADCDHVASGIHTGQGMAGGGGHKAAQVDKIRYSGACAKCGAVRTDSQIGHESTPDEHVSVMVALFRELRRALHKKGVLILNYGDCYASSANGRSAADTKSIGRDDRTFRDKPFSTTVGGLKPKDLVGMPWRVALALQADGWYLRSAIPWIKFNPMPESIKDRPSNAHEYIFLFSKSSRYYWDSDSIRRPIKTESINRLMRGVSATHKTVNGAPGQTPHTMNQPRQNIKKRDASTTFKRNGSKREQAIPGQSVGTHRHDRSDTEYNPLGRNFRTSDTFWDSLDQYISYLLYVRDNGGLMLNEIGNPVALLLAIRPYPDAHFAVFSPDLVKPFILAGASDKGVCPHCGAPWVRCVTAGWCPSCKCEDNTPIPAVVLDPFIGSGTVAQVATELGRSWIGFELNQDYIKLASNRLHGTQRELVWL